MSSIWSSRKDVVVTSCLALNDNGDCLRWLPVAPSLHTVTIAGVPGQHTLITWWNRSTPVTTAPGNACQQTVIFWDSYVFSKGLVRGSQRDVVYLGWPIGSSYMNPKTGGGGGSVAGSQPLSKAMHNAHETQINFGDLLHINLWVWVTVWYPKT